MEVGKDMNIKKELVKSLILLALILSSIFLSYKITSYRPSYDRLFEGQSKQNNDILSKNKANSLNLLSPDLVIKHKKSRAEEMARLQAITKISKVAAVNKKSDIKKILEEISDKDIDLVRIREAGVTSLLQETQEYFVMNYPTEIDSAASKFIYLLNENLNTSINFNRVLLTDTNKNTLYLYTEGRDNYMQIVFKEEIFANINKIFEEKSKVFGRYLIGPTQKEFYVEENLNEYTIDTYKAEPLDIRSMFANISERNTVSKISDIDDKNREITDGYSMMKESADLIYYINPANTNPNLLLKDIEAKTQSANYLISTYIPNQDYSLADSLANLVEYRENYKGAKVYAGSETDKIKVELAREGVHKVTYPRYIRGEQISSQARPLYHMDSLDAILNYLYANTELEKLESVDLVYEKTFDAKENTLRYEPNWYIKYDGKNYSFKKLKADLGRG